MPARNSDLEKTAIEYAHQAQRLSHKRPQDGSDNVAAEAKLVTPRDAVIVTTEGHRLPTVPLEEAHKLHSLRDALEMAQSHHGDGDGVASEGRVPVQKEKGGGTGGTDGNLDKAMPPTHTNPLFPPLPLYGPPSLLRDVQCLGFRVSSFFLSLSFLGVIVLASVFTSLPPFCYSMYLRMTFRDPDADRPFYREELRRRGIRETNERQWKRRNSDSKARVPQDMEDSGAVDDGFVPSEGGPDPIVCDVGYYARRVGLDVEEFQVQTEDGFIIDLLHVYDPREHTPLPVHERRHRGPDVFTAPRRTLGEGEGESRSKPKFPVLLVHGLLQSAGAYTVNDDDSLAFYLCKSGFDVWLGNNRCGFKPKHALLDYGDPRMWNWNIRQMGVFDLPAMVSRVLFETGFSKVGLVCHSQGTTQTFVALAKEQRPGLGDKLSVVCALAPAVYAGPLIGKMYLKFMRIISPTMFRLVFGIHSFIPFMMTMLATLNPHAYGWLGYKVFSFLFDWSDRRWDRGLRDRMFQFAPVYVSSESMRWWLGRECFAKHKCILATREEWRAEEREDLEADPGEKAELLRRPCEKKPEADQPPPPPHARRPKGSTAWYDEHVPPFALWVCGRDYLIDGQRLLRRFARGREPHVDVVHAKVIEDYEHLDVIWAMDAPQQVFGEVDRWKTCNARDMCRVPKGCEDVPAWTKKAKASPPSAERQSSDDGMQSSSGGEESAA